MIFPAELSAFRVQQKPVSRAKDFQPGPDHFQSKLSPFGNSGFSISIAGIVIRFEGASNVILDHALESYAPFLSSEKADEVVQLAFGEAEYLMPQRHLRLELDDFKEGQILTSHEFCAFRSADGSSRILRVSNPSDTDSALRCIETYLRWSIASLAVRRKAFVLHSAGLVLAGKAYLFCGHSGAGKSTVVSLTAEAEILSDDLVLIHKEQERWMSATTPFAGSFPQRHKKAGSFPIDQLFLLKKSDQVFTRKIAAALAVGALLSNCPFLSNEERYNSLFPLIEDLMRSVPIRELYFRKEPSFWNVIRQS